MSTFLSSNAFARYKRLWQNWISIFTYSLLQLNGKRKTNTIFYAIRFEWLFVISVCFLLLLLFFLPFRCFTIICMKWRETVSLYKQQIRTIYGFMVGLKKICIKIWFTVNKRAWDEVRTIDAHTNWNRRFKNQIALVCIQI